MVTGYSPHGGKVPTEAAYIYTWKAVSDGGMLSFTLSFLYSAGCQSVGMALPGVDQDYPFRQAQRLIIQVILQFIKQTVEINCHKHLAIDCLLVYLLKSHHFHSWSTAVASVNTRSISKEVVKTLNPRWGIYGQPWKTSFCLQGIISAKTEVWKH